MWSSLGLALLLGLLGFVEPCTIGAHLVFLNSQRGRSLRARLSSVTAFLLARLLVMGGFGGAVVLLGQRLIGVQTAGWLVFGAVYLGLGMAFLSGGGKRFRRPIRIAPAAWRAARSPWIQGPAFGLNIPACAAPILFGVVGPATATGSALAGFVLMSGFAMALSLPLVPLSILPQLARPLERLAEWLRPRRGLVGFLFVGLGIWSVWFGLFVDPVDWSGR